LLAASALISACGGGESNATAKASGDTEPPEIREVRGSLGDPNPGTLDLSKADAERALPSPTPFTLQVFASDDTTETEGLTVQALDDAREPLADQTAVLHNGLWQISTTAKAGLTVRLVVRDAAGNATEWPYAAIFPSRAQSLVQTWTLLVYDAKANVIERPTVVFGDDQWCEDDTQAGDGPQGGTWSLRSDGRLKVETRHHSACDSVAAAAATAPVESSRTSDFYVDATYFSDRPYQREGGPGAEGDVTGTWSYGVDLLSEGKSKTLTPTLMLANDGTFTQDTEDGHSVAGTYEVTPNANYSADFGELLYLTVTEMDGAPVKAATAVHYFKLVAGLLVVDPFVQLP
jgi:hypothetical protein